MNKGEFKNPVFLIALILCTAIAVWAIAFNESFTDVSNAIFGFLTVDFGWLYLLAMLAFVIFALAIAFSHWGKIKLGPDDSELEDLVTSLVGSEEVLRQNSVALDGYDADITEESERVAADIDQADDFEAALVAAIDKAKREGADPAKVHFVENEVLFPLEHQRQYLQSLLAVNQQAALSLSILRETNVALINNVRIITLATKHSVGIAKTLRSFSAGGGASPVGTPSSTPGMAALEASIDDLFAAFERHDLWHAEVTAKTQEAVGELQDLTEKVFDGTPHGYHHR